MLDIDLSKISLKVIFKQLNSEEALQKMEYEQTRQEALDRLVTSLGNLGIDFSDGKYRNTRNELILRFMDNTLLDLIKKDEEELSKLPPSPTQEPTEDTDELEPLPPMSDFSSIEDSPRLGDEDIPNEVSPEDTELPDVEPSEPTDDGNTNPDPPYSLG